MTHEHTNPSIRHTALLAAEQSARSIGAMRRRRARGASALFALTCLALPAVTACRGETARASESSFCAQLKDSVELAGTFGEPETESSDVAAAFERLADLAPEAISADVRVVTDAIVTVAETPTDDPDGLAAALDAVLSPEVKTATERIGAYAVEVCGIEPTAWTT